MSVDTILTDFKRGVISAHNNNYGENVWNAEDWAQKQAVEALHSLLISKLPEKSEVKYKKWIDGKIVDKKSPVVCPRCLWLSKSYRHCENCGKHINTKEVE